MWEVLQYRFPHSGRMPTSIHTFMYARECCTIICFDRKWSPKLSCVLCCEFRLLSTPKEACAAPQHCPTASVYAGIWTLPPFSPWAAVQSWADQALSPMFHPFASKCLGDVSHISFQMKNNGKRCFRNQNHCCDYETLLLHIVGFYDGRL